jgi:L-asparaginase
VDYLSGQGYKGMVIEAFGRGNVPPETAFAVKRAIGAGIVVAITSRCYEGRVLGVYAYEGGCVDLIDAGAITAGDMQGHKIRLLLMSALGRGMNAEGIRGLLGRL